MESCSCFISAVDSRQMQGAHAGPWKFGCSQEGKSHPVLRATGLPQQTWGLSRDWAESCPLRPASRVTAESQQGAVKGLLSRPGWQSGSPLCLLCLGQEESLTMALVTACGWGTWEDGGGLGSPPLFFDKFENFVLPSFRSKGPGISSGSLSPQRTV